MNVTFLHHGMPERPGADFGATYNVGGYVTWRDPTGASYVKIGGDTVEVDPIGLRWVVFSSGGKSYDIPWHAVTDMLDETMTVPMLWLAETYAPQFCYNHSIAIVE